MIKIYGKKEQDASRDITLRLIQDDENSENVVLVIVNPITGDIVDCGYLLKISHHGITCFEGVNSNIGIKLDSGQAVCVNYA